MADIVADWFEGDGEELKNMSRRATVLGRPEATFDIVRELSGMFRMQPLLLVYFGKLLARLNRHGMPSSLRPEQHLSI